MAGQLAVYGSLLALEAIFDNPVYIGLVTALPSSPFNATLADFAANELAVAGYSRKSSAWSYNMVNQTVSASNQTPIEFGPFTEDPPTVNACFATDVASGTTGNVLAFWTFSSGVDATINDILRFQTGHLVMNLSPQ